MREGRPFENVESGKSIGAYGKRIPRSLSLSSIYGPHHPAYNDYADYLILLERHLDCALPQQLFIFTIVLTAVFVRVHILRPTVASTATTPA